MTPFKQYNSMVVYISISYEQTHNWIYVRNKFLAFSFTIPYNAWYGEAGTRDRAEPITEHASG